MNPRPYNLQNVLTDALFTALTRCNCEAHLTATEIYSVGAYLTNEVIDEVVLITEIEEEEAAQ